MSSRFEVTTGVLQRCVVVSNLVRYVYGQSYALDSGQSYGWWH